MDSFYLPDSGAYSPSSSTAPPHVMYAQGLEGEPPSVQTRGLPPWAAEKAASGAISFCVAATSCASGTSSHGRAGWADVFANG